MANIEFAITLQDNKKVSARRDNADDVTEFVRLDKLDLKLIDIFEKWLGHAKISDLEELQAFGALLYRALFAGQIERLFEQALSDLKTEGQRLRVQLSFREEAIHLASLPWEFLYSPDTDSHQGFFMATHRDLVLSRYMPYEKDRPQSLVPAESPLRILIAVSQPTDAAPVTTEPVIEAIQALGKSQPVQVEILTKSTVREFLLKIKNVRPHVLHFIGHGKFDKPSGSGAIGLLNPDETVRWIPDREFTDYFQQMGSTPRLVVLHTCAGGTVDFEGNFGGMAPQLMRANIPAVVAMRYPITNRAAISFSRAFYQQLSEFKPVDNAVQVARWQMTIDDPNCYNTGDFGTPVLYMRSREGVIQSAAKLGPIS
jgi:hypothetical protein